MTHGLVYRDSEVLRSQAELVDEVLVELKRRDLPGALLAASALETALADVHDELTNDVAQLTDSIARAFVDRRTWEPSAFLARIDSWRSPRILRTSTPAAFAYDGLSPRAWADSARKVLDAPGPLVIGIRAVGTTLSALAMAALPSARRITVRPQGHPSDRELSFEAPDREAIAQHHHFLIADEGPGNSGSSFLAVTEALVGLGVAASHITLLGTRAFDPGQLVAPDAERRIRRFRFFVAGASAQAMGEEELSHGKWSPVLRAGLPRIALWSAKERAKYLSADCTRLRKFSGLGARGRRVHRRAVELAAQGFTPPPLGPPDEDGFISHHFIAGRPLTKADELAAHLGRYIAARPRVVLASEDEAALERSLQEMVRVNVELELGVPAPALPSIERLVIADGKLMPYEWLVDERGRVLKTDAVDHGDDHLFPGPTDSAWDLAGAIIEWSLGGGARERLLRAYREASGEDPGPRLQPYLVAYSAFRARACVIASLGGSAEDAALWAHAHSGYTRALREALLPVRRQREKTPAMGVAV